MTNRSVPANIVLPHVVYTDVAGAVVWLARVFGFAEHFRYGDPAAPSGAQVCLGDAWFMLSSARPGRTSPRDAGCATQMLTVFVDDVDAHYRKTQAAGARIVEELHETIYGERQYVAEDCEGHHWVFSRHVRDLSPAEWGATIAPTYN